MPQAQVPDLFENKGENARRIFTVSEITSDIKELFSIAFGNGIWVEGEISNFKAATSGHFYFSLKDSSAVISAAMFASANKALKFKLEDGQKVICFGRVDVYAPRGSYQIIIERIEPKGIGAQALAFEQLKKKLSKEGLFEPASKIELPLMPFRVGIVTSSAGAAVRDILQILKRGASCVDVVIRSVRVQGDGAYLEIAAAIDDFNKFEQVDVIIVSRGGGSIEDLWAFNEEAVARSIYNSVLPVISAVGHQINFTLSDLAADVFVETPSAAAKIIVDKRNASVAEIEHCASELKFLISQVISRLDNSLTSLRNMLKSPKDSLMEKAQLLDESAERLNKSMEYILNIAFEKKNSLIERLGALSPLAVLSRGYSLSMLALDDSIIKEAQKLNPGDLVKTKLFNGSFISRVEEVN